MAGTEKAVLLEGASKDTLSLLSNLPEIPVMARNGENEEIGENGGHDLFSLEKRMNALLDHSSRSHYKKTIDNNSSTTVASSDISHTAVGTMIEGDDEFVRLEGVDALREYAESKDGPSKICDRLWLGPETVLKDRAFFVSERVTHVVSVCEMAPSADLVRVLFENVLARRCRKSSPSTSAGSSDRPLSLVLHLSAARDKLNYDIAKHFNEAIVFVDCAMRMGGCVFVHCHRGVSRSASVVIAFLLATRAKEFGNDVGSVLKRVQERRSVVAPNASFMAQLAVWWKKRDQTRPWGVSS